MKNLLKDIRSYYGSNHVYESNDYQAFISARAGEGLIKNPITWTIRPDQVIGETEIEEGLALFIIMPKENFSYDGEANYIANSAKYKLVDRP